VGEQLREHLEALHSELTSTPSVDDRSKQLLEEVLADIRELLERTEPAAQDEHQSLGERLRDATQHFEDSHPTLSTAVGRVVDALSNLGI
jgi:signal transduction histidine kinase